MPLKDQSRRAKVRTFSAHEMLDAIARYHGSSKSAMSTVWRVFSNGTETIPPDEGAQVKP